VCFKDQIVVPNKLQHHVIEWYHTVLYHTGIDCTELFLSTYTGPRAENTSLGMFRSVLPVRGPKQRSRNMDHSPKELEAVPWDKMCIDLTGPNKICRKGQKDLVCRRVTTMDPATGWFEIHEYDDKKSTAVANIAEQEWFARYSWPTQITYNRGSEFMVREFQHMIKMSMELRVNPL
jgi:hypothetical protein